MEQAKKSITYHVIPDRGHCDIGDDMKALFLEYAVREIEKSNG